MTNISLDGQNVSVVCKTSGTLFFARKDTMYVFEVKFSGFECLPGIFCFFVSIHGFWTI